jgi:hypothetical protein
MTQKFHFCIYNQKNWKLRPKQIFVYSCLRSHIQDIQKVEAAQVSLNRWMYKQEPVCVYP